MNKINLINLDLGNFLGQLEIRLIKSIFKKMHLPVLLKEVIEILNPKPGEFFVDGTLGGGGHALEILKRIGPSGKFLGIDRDGESLERALNNLNPKPENLKLIFKHANFSEIPEILKNENLGRANGILLDLGFSSLQIEESGRGFSFLRDEPLFMTYDSSQTSVKELLKKLTETELAQIIRKFGEEKFAGRIARNIKEYIKKNKEISTSLKLAEIVKNAVPKFYERGRIHPATRTFQALRIYANNELDHLEKFLNSLPNILLPGGRVVIISFNSLEDRLVKNYFRDFSKENKLSLITKKPITPSSLELLNNNRSRSAKLRAAFRLSG